MGADQREPAAEGQRLSAANGPLSLREASALLGVHPSTLRRWADAGDIAVTITPGGHRRFAPADLARFAADRQRTRLVAGSEQTWAQQALVRTRTAL
ncbi:MAG: helix-turn-helix domain-containing protein, partial [Chloroflexales bacterium]|nr:helix-turn-helix domain-containing protein [Chloroflexales bacterium]